MCGKFRSMESWAEVYEALTTWTPGAKEGGGGGGNDREVVFGVGHKLPVIRLNAETGKREIVMMRWGFPDPANPARPRPIHARGETVDEKYPFRRPFAEGRRGVVIFKTFNEGEETLTSGGKPKTIQWTVDPQDGVPRGFAFVWDSFDIGEPQPLLACVMVTVPANQLLRETVLVNDTDPRMPAILRDDDDWSLWLGEQRAPLEEVKAVLQTMEGVRWKVEREPKKPKPPRS